MKKIYVSFYILVALFTYYIFNLLFPIIRVIKYVEIPDIGQPDTFWVTPRPNPIGIVSLIMYLFLFTLFYFSGFKELIAKGGFSKNTEGILLCVIINFVVFIIVLQITKEIFWCGTSIDDLSILPYFVGFFEWLYVLPVWMLLRKYNNKASKSFICTAAIITILNIIFIFIIVLEMFRALGRFFGSR